MNKKKKIIYFLILVLGLFFLRAPDTYADSTGDITGGQNVEEDNSLYEKGELRCPPELEDSSNTCTPLTDSNGKVIQVTISHTEHFSDSSWVTIEKIVKKTDTLGTFSVQFRVKGNGSFLKVSEGRVNVIVVFDKSKTMTKKKAAIEAIKDFSEKVVAQGENYYISLIQFAKRTQSQATFSNEPIKTIKNDYGISSHLEKALKLAYNTFLDVNEGKNYMIVFGDGRYYLDYKSSTCNGEGNGGEKNNCTTRWRESEFADNSVEYWLRQLNTLDVTKFAVRYNGTTKKYSGLVWNKNAYVAGCEQLNYQVCDQLYMQKVVSPSPTSYVQEAQDSADYTEFFNKVLSQLKADVKKTAEGIYGELSDRIGNNFYFPEDSATTGRYKNFDIEKISSDSWFTTKEFNVEIDSYAPEGWHKINEDFALKVQTSEGSKTITVKDNPEAYWKPVSTVLKSCHDAVTADTIKDDDSDMYNYYSKICYEGYTEKNKYQKGFTVEANVDDTKNGTNSIFLKDDRGFPVTLKLSTNVICTYKFDFERFSKDYKSINERIALLNEEIEDELERQKEAGINSDNKETNEENNSEDNEEGEEDNNENEPEEDTYVPLVDVTALTQEIYDLESSKRSMANILETYKQVSEDTRDLEEYATRFIDEQTATLTVKYDENPEYDKVSFTNIGEPAIPKPNCQTRATNKSPIDGKVIITDRVCKLSMSKEMEIAGACLNMQTGEYQECSSEIAQIAGGNKFYIKSKEPSGQIIINVPKAGYRGNLDIVLDKYNDKNACTFTAQSSDVVFREIDVNEPFLSDIDPNRGVGENYLNSKFDFEKIIHGDIWNDSDKAEYVYDMSKTNIANIKSDTNSDPSNSYLGQNCYFTNTNKYYCGFTRNESSIGSDNGDYWFYFHKYPER